MMSELALEINGTESGGKQAHKCTICSQQFENLQECLKHELLQHSSKPRPPKSLRQKLNAIRNTLKTDEQIALHKQLRAELQQCKPGEELGVTLKHHRMNDENLTLVYERIYACLKKELVSLQPLQIHAFGSFVSALALRDSDIDLYIEQVDCCHSAKAPNDMSSRRVFNRINKILHRSSCFSDVIAIRQARVPIIKCKHKPTGFSLDINLSCPSSVHNSAFLRDLMQFDRRLHELTIFLKIWAKQLQIIGRSNMTSYCLIVLVIFYLQQPRRDEKFPLLPSMKTLQTNAPPNVVVGVNYAFDLNANMSPLPRNVSTLELIKGFFSFYRTFEFGSKIIAPYLGEALSMEHFKAGKIEYPAYHNQLRAITILSRETVEPLQVDRCVCVQDPFSLNHNIAKSLMPPNLDYFRKCVTHAWNLCEEMSTASTSTLYTALLYDIVERIAQAEKLHLQALQSVAENAPSEITSATSSNNPHELHYRFTPGRNELRALAQHCSITDQETLYQRWVQHYKDAISEIITDVYRLDMQTATPTHRDKCQRLENTDLSTTWLLSGSIDQWTGRLHKRMNNMTFMEFQRAQTERFHQERRQNAQYAVQLSATLTFSIICNGTAIELVAAPRGSSAIMLCKKSPLRKFFMMFKCSMQNYNLKERLEEKERKKCVDETKTV